MITKVQINTRSCHRQREPGDWDRKTIKIHCIKSFFRSADAGTEIPLYPIIVHSASIISRHYHKDKVRIHTIDLMEPCLDAYYHLFICVLTNYVNNNDNEIFEGQFFLCLFSIFFCIVTMFTLLFRSLFSSFFIGSIVQFNAEDVSAYTGRINIMMSWGLTFTTHKSVSTLYNKWIGINLCIVDICGLKSILMDLHWSSQQFAPRCFLFRK